jgi:hypothetical protein
MDFYPKAAMERAMKVQEVILRAMAKKITWWQAAEIIGISDRHMRRWRERYEEFDVLSILLPSMPIPEQDTPWDRILDFRSDPLSRDKFVRFRRWAEDLGKHPEQIRDLNEKLDWMIFDYAKHMEFYKMKTRQSLFEVLVSTAADLVFSLPKVLLGLAKPGFALKKREYELMEADFNAPGKEIAYLYDAKQSFQSF